MTYADAFESVKLQLDQTIGTNWLATLEGQDLWTGQDILNNDAASINKRITRGKITAVRVMELVDSAIQLKLTTGALLLTRMILD